MAQELLRRDAIGVCEAFLTGGWDDEASIGVRLEIEGPEDTAQQVRAHGPDRDPRRKNAAPAAGDAGLLR